MSQGMTATEKILAEHSGLSRVTPGQFVNAKVDMALANDATAGKIIARFREIEVERVFDPEKVVFVLDHYTPSNNIASATVCQETREFTQTAGGQLIEVGKGGIEHCVLPERGLVLPGDLLVGQDSHTCQHGALGAFATAIGVTDMAATLALGEVWLMVPTTLKFQLVGQTDDWASGKDLALFIISQIGVDGALYRAMEFSGETIENLRMDGRFTLCNMAVDCGAKNAFIAADGVTDEYEKGRAKRPYTKVNSDPDAQYEKVYEWDVSGLRPQVARPHIPSNVVSIDEAERVPVNQVFIGSCTNGGLDDMKAAAEVFAGRQVHAGVRAIVIPGSQEVYLESLRQGYIESFIEAGAAVSTPTCGPCFGGHMGIVAEGEVCVSTTNRNFPGRMGHSKSSIYLVNPAVAAATAVAGYLTSPEEVLA